MNDIIEDIKDYRLMLGLSQVDFAERFGLPVQTYVQWERRRREPEMSAKVLLSLIIHSPDAVMKTVRRNTRREMAGVMAGASI
jgi:putative transcriptional regulator